MLGLFQLKEKNNVSEFVLSYIRDLTNNDTDLLFHAEKQIKEKHFVGEIYDITTATLLTNAVTLSAETNAGRFLFHIQRLYNQVTISIQPPNAIRFTEVATKYFKTS